MIMTALHGHRLVHHALVSESNVDAQVGMSSLECHISKMTDDHRQLCLEAARDVLRNRSNRATWLHRVWNSNCPDTTGFRHLVRGYRYDVLSHSMVWGLPTVLTVLMTRCSVG
jgi:hypothetical protein